MQIMDNPIVPYPECIADQSYKTKERYSIIKDTNQTESTYAVLIPFTLAKMILTIATL